MDDNAMTVIRAFRDFDKSAAAVPPQFRSKADNKKNKADRAAKKPWLTKEPISDNSAKKEKDVAVECVDKKAAAAALEAISSLPAAPEARRPSGVTNAKVAQVAHLRAMFQANKQKQDQLSAIGNTLEPKTAAAGAQAQDPYAAMQELAEHGQLLQKAIPGLDPSVVLQGQQMGVDMSPGGIKKRLGAHEMIARGKKILRDEKKNSATGAAGSPAGGNPAAAGQPQGQQPQPQQPPMVAAAKLHSIDMTKVAQGLAAAGMPKLQKPFALATDLSQPINPQAKLPIMPGAGAASAAAQPQDSAPSEAEKQGEQKQSSEKMALDLTRVGQIMEGLGLRGLGAITRVGALPLRWAGRGFEYAGGKIGKKLPTIGQKVTGAGTSLHETGRLGKLTGKTMRAAGKRIGKGSTASVFNRPSIRFVKDVAPSDPGVARGFALGALPGDIHSKLVGENLSENLKKILGASRGIGGRLALGAPTLLGLDIARRGAGRLLGSGSNEQEQPEEEEQEPKTEKKSSAGLGLGVKPLVHESGFRTREGFKNTHRQEVFDDLAKWSLGAKTIG